MNYIAYSLQDRVAVQVVAELRKLVPLEEQSTNPEYTLYSGKACKVVALSGPSITADFLDTLGAERIIFVSRHSSAKGVTSFTAHANGNWSNSNDYGGKPKELSVASPLYMLGFLAAVSKPAAALKMPVTYEATHHGPLLDTPSLFVEIGPVEGVMGQAHASAFAGSVAALLDGTEPEFDKVAIGIGGTHYPEKFTRLALSGKYAFSHIMSKYYTGEADMLEKAAQRSEMKPELAVLDWKGIGSADRAGIIAGLARLGLDYERA